MSRHTESPDQKLSRDMRRPDRASYDEKRRRLIRDAKKSWQDQHDAYNIGVLFGLLYTVFIVFPLKVISIFFFIIVWFFKNINSIMLIFMFVSVTSLVLFVLWLIIFN